MSDEQKLSDVAIQVSERGFEQVRVYADDAGQRERALCLLIRIGPQLRALEKALKQQQHTTTARTDVVANLPEGSTGFDGVRQAARKAG
jgi:hypothetical protein